MWRKCGNLLRQRRKLQPVHGIRQGNAIQNGGGFVAHLQHDLVQLALFFRHAVLASFMCEAAGTGDQRQGSPGNPYDVAVPDIDGRQQQPIAPIASALRTHQPFARHFGKNDGQELGGNILRFRYFLELDRAPPIAISEILQRPERVSGPLGEHISIIMVDNGNVMAGRREF